MVLAKMADRRVRIPRKRLALVASSRATPADSVRPRSSTPPSIVEELRRENARLRLRLTESEDTLRAIHDGEVDAIVVQCRDGPRVFSLTGAETMYRRAVETMQEAVINLTPDGCILFCNTRLAAFLGMPLDRVLGQDLHRFVRAEDHDLLDGLLRHPWKAPATQRLVLHGAGPMPVPVHVSASLTEQAAGTTIVVVATNLAELEASTTLLRQLRQQQEALRASQDALRRSEAIAQQHLKDLEDLYRTAPVGMCSMDTDLRWMRINDRLAALNGFPVEAHLGRHIRELLPALAAAVETPMRRVLATGEPIVGIEIESPDVEGGPKRTWRANWLPQRNATGEVVGINVVAEDITEQKRTEEALRQGEERYRAVVEDQTEIISRFTPAGTFTFVNDVFCRFFGKSGEALLGSTWQESAVPGDVPKIESRLRGLSPANPVAVVESRVQTSDGTTRWMQFINRGSFDADGNLVEIQSVGRDITDRRRAEDASRASEARYRVMFEASTVLLRELHHRVKNNLQIVSSLLSLEAGESRSAAVRSRFRDSQLRIDAMALVHEKLYRSEQMTTVSVRSYMHDLVLGLMRAYGVDPSRVRLDLHVGQVSLSIDTAIPLGLILNELASNAFKHAFPGRRTGHLQIRLVPNVQNRYCLVVADNGVGLPQGMVWNQVDSLGLTLVQRLVEQLEGTCECETNPGTTFRVRFADTRAAPTGAPELGGTP